jgi:DNA-binding NarL/FixJ family response regulator
LNEKEQNPMAAQPQLASRTSQSRLLRVDDHPVIRQGLSLFLGREQDLIVCGEANNAESALQSISALQPDLVIMDISHSGPDGLDILKQVRTYSAVLPVLVLSMHDEMIYAARALRSGANGYIMKQESVAKVLDAIRRILRGEIYLSHRLANSMLCQHAYGNLAIQADPIVNLSDRELEIFRLIGEGRTTRQIADQLRVSVKTIESYHGTY